MPNLIILHIQNTIMINTLLFYINLYLMQSFFESYYVYKASFYVICETIVINPPNLVSQSRQQKRNINIKNILNFNN